MSILRCEQCDREIDTDTDPEGEEIDGWWLCSRCADKASEETPDEEIHRINNELADMRVRSMKRGHLNQLIGE